MILYNNNSELIGISKNQLSFLGYDDLNDFKTYVNDVADLFVKKSGYVHKFVNFSWIDYVMHSGASNKGAMVKLKNGREVEVKIRVKEIMHLDGDEEKDFYYGVELIRVFSADNSDDISESLEFGNDKTEQMPKKGDKKEKIEKSNSEDKCEKEDEDVALKNAAEDEKSPKEDNEQEDFILLKDDDEKSSAKQDDDIDNAKEKDKKSDIFKDFIAREFEAEEPIIDENSLEYSDYLIDDYEEEQNVSSVSSLEEDLCTPKSSISLSDEDCKEGKLQSSYLILDDEDDLDIIGDSDEFTQDDDFMKAHALPSEDLANDEMIKNLKSLGIGEDKADEIIDEFLDYANDESKKIKGYIENNDIRNIENIIVSLKSLAELLGISSLTQTLDRLYSDADSDFITIFEEFKDKIENLKRKRA